jgi:serine/threonine protein kinase
VHSDFKPENILIFNDGVKIADFGSCMPPKSDNWGDGITIRSPEIMMKNSERDKYKGYPHDIFAFGYSIYELASPENKKPYCVANDFEISQEKLYSVEFQEIHDKKLQEAWPQSDNKAEMHIRDLAMKLMTINPANRQDANNVVLSIKNILSELRS